MDQYIYKTFKMLQNGLYWSFYCSSIWIFVQTVEGSGEGPAGGGGWSGERLLEQILAKWTTHQRAVTSNTLMKPRPHHLPLPRKIKKKKNSNQSSRRLFSFSLLQSSTVQPLNKKSGMGGREKGAVRGGWWGRGVWQTPSKKKNKKKN